MKEFLIKNGLVLLGALTQGLGMGLFLFPHSIPSGGAGGLTVLLNYLFHINFGLAYWLVSFSLLLFGVKVLGKRFALWTILAITISSWSVDFFIQHVELYQRNLLLDLLFGSTFLGVGMGLLMRQGVSNGGIGVVALIIASRKKILPGKPLLLINVCIFFITAIVIDLKIIFFALISQWISTRVIDIVCVFSFRQSYTLDWRRKT